MKNATILIVDDDPASVNTLVAYLHHAGFRTMVAPSGKRALRQIKLTQPDLILLDVFMPGLDGFETCRRFKKIQTARDIPVIFMTARADLFDNAKGIEAGGVDYLTKPLDYAEVLARIKTYISGRHLPKEEGVGKRSR